MAAPYDVAVLGGGLAGSTLALRLAQAGRRVVLLERGEMPRDKLCGEFLSPESKRLARALGVLDALEAAKPASIRSAHFHSSGGRTVDLRLPGAGLGLSRRVLDQVLFERARAAGADVRTQAQVEGVAASGRLFRVELADKGAGASSLEAHWVVAAHGRRGKLDRALARSEPGESRFAGLKQHHRASPALANALDGRVEVHTFEGGYCGMSFVEEGRVNVCMLVRSELLRRFGGELEGLKPHLAELSPSLAQRLEGLTPVEGSPVLAVAEVPFGPREQYLNGVCFVGDAAGMIAPLAGDGQAMAIDSAAVLADLLLDAPRDPEAPDRDRLGRHWSRSWSRRFGLRLRIGGALQRRLLDPPRAERLFKTVGGVPGLASLLTRLTRG